MGRIPAVLLAPYPPGIAVMMPGEKFTESCKVILDYFVMVEECENKYPGFEEMLDIHGITVVEEGDDKVYKVICVKQL